MMPFRGFYMSDISRRLIDFFVAKAPVQAWPFPNFAARLSPGYPAGSNLHFILDLVTKDTDPDPRAKARAAFGVAQADDVAALRQAHDSVWKTFRTGVFDQGDLEAVRAMPPVMRRIAVGFEQRMERVAAKIKEMDKAIREHHLRHNAYLKKRDYDALLNYYPNMASILHARDMDVSAEILDAPKGNVYPLLRRARAEALRREIESPHPLIVRPEIIADMEVDQARFRVMARQDGVVLGAVQTIASGMDRILAPQKPVAQIVAFPRPQ